MVTTFVVVRDLHLGVFVVFKVLVTRNVRVGPNHVNTVGCEPEMSFTDIFRHRELTRSM